MAGRAWVYGAAGWVRWDTNGKAYTVYLRIAEDGRITDLVISGLREINAARLRELPLARYRAEALSRPDLALAAWDYARDAPDFRDFMESLFPDAPSRRAARLGRPVTLRPPTEGLTAKFLKEVADAYKDVVARGERRPNAALAAQAGVEKRSVERWVYLARKKGLLPATRQGQAR
jgi:hypothetical protein